LPTEPAKNTLKERIVLPEELKEGGGAERGLNGHSSSERSREKINKPSDAKLF